MSQGRIIVVGASHAGAQLCASLRQEGWREDIVLIGDEPEPPYHRPPLSKTFLTGYATLDDLLIRAPDFYTKQGITLQTGRVTAIHREAHRITMADVGHVAAQHLDGAGAAGDQRGAAADRQQVQPRSG